MGQIPKRGRFHLARTLWCGQYFHPLVDLDVNIAAENKNRLRKKKVFSWWVLDFQEVWWRIYSNSFIFYVF